MKQLYALHGLKEPSSQAPPPSFPLLIPLHLAQKINPLDPLDPLLLQFACAPLTSQIEPQKDPLQEKKAQITPKLLKKYPMRALLLPTSACAMHCRYCFRQNYPYAKNDSQGEEKRNTLALEAELSAIKSDPSLREIILSGGDPLSLSNRDLHHLVSAIEEMEQIERIRWHTRFPIGIPERVDQGLLNMIKQTKKRHLWVLHINHAKELDAKFLRYIDQVRQLGVPLLAQAVLLRGVNDHVETLYELSETLSNAGIIFYYLHQLDPVEGATSFWVDPQKGIELIEQLRRKTSGYGVPTFAQEIALEESKIALA